MEATAVQLACLMKSYMTGVPLSIITAFITNVLNKLKKKKGSYITRVGPGLYEDKTNYDDK